MDILVTSKVLEALRKSAKAVHPHEACGILIGDRRSLGKHARVLRYVEAANVHATPRTHFEIDPRALIDAYLAERSEEGEAQVLGFFHSHPQGAARPSKTDAAMAAGDGKIWSIWGKDEITWWHSTLEGFEPLSYSLIEG